MVDRMRMDDEGGFAAYQRQDELLSQHVHQIPLYLLHNFLMHVYVGVSVGQGKKRGEERGGMRVIVMMMH